LPNSEPDLGGYFLYRRTQGTEPQRLNSEPVKSPAFRDPNIVAGERYFYSVSAVDLRGNESARSQEASEAVPQQ
jgi:fibronectin type 3 domain-containing protein